MGGVNQGDNGAAARDAAARGMPVQVLAAISDPKLEGALLPELVATGRLRIEPCASARELLEALRGGSARAGAVLTHSDLPHLADGEGALDQIVRRGIPLVLLAHDTGDPRWADVPAVILPLDATPREIEEGLERALRGERSGAAAPRRTGRDRSRSAPPAAERRAGAVGDAAEAPAEGGAESDRRGIVYVVASGPGAPGRTTLALGLATALGTVEPTVLVDADLHGPSLAAILDANPAKNLYMLAGAAPRTPREWVAACEEELQPLGDEAPHGRLICGVPKGGRGTKISPQFLARALEVLKRRFDHIVLDIADDLTGSDPAPVLGRAALGRADHVVLVGTGDLASLARCQETYHYCLNTLGIDPPRLALVINRYDRRVHYGVDQIEELFGLPLAAVIPADHGAAGRALVAGHSLVLEGRSRAARAILELAGRAHGGRIERPVAPRKTRRPFGAAGPGGSPPQGGPPDVSRRVETARREGRFFGRRGRGAASGPAGGD